LRRVAAEPHRRRAVMPLMQVLSLGAGVQSTTMALMAAHGEITPMPDCAIFADTQFEPESIMKHLNWLETQLPFPVHRVTAGDLRADTAQGINTTGQRFAPIPFFTENGGMARRQCTTEYKIEPIRKKLRELLGLKYRQRAPKEIAIRQWIGISTDEAMRMKPSRDAWVENVWPLIDAGMSRQSCLRWFEQRYPLRPLVKSACIACPFRNDAGWREMKIDDPLSFAEAVEFDHAIRNKGQMAALKQELFVHRSCKPLDEVDFRNLEDMGQLNFFNDECEGVCGV
jgi:3'-phosphoadenosine 5'-phosphosulfate sulfotransferase (PAPS reductase)/FAD synthetase